MKGRTIHGCPDCKCADRLPVRVGSIIQIYSQRAEQYFTVKVTRVCKNYFYIEGRDFGNGWAGWNTYKSEGKSWRQIPRSEVE